MPAVLPRKRVSVKPSHSRSLTLLAPRLTQDFGSLCPRSSSTCTTLLVKHNSLAMSGWRQLTWSTGLVKWVPIREMRDNWCATSLVSKGIFTGLSYLKIHWLTIWSLVDDITHRQAVKNGFSGTETAILGPFWRQDTPIRENGTTITFDTPSDGKVAYLYGTVTSATTGKPIPNASVDVWQASTNGMWPSHKFPQPVLISPGLYEQQDDKQVEHNLRGKFITDDQGRYSFYCLRPTPYPVCDISKSCFNTSRLIIFLGSPRWPSRQASSKARPPRLPSRPLALHGKLICGPNPRLWY